MDNIVSDYEKLRTVEEKVLDFFGFNEQPFSSTPNPRFLFITNKHKSIMHKLMYSIEGRQGLSVVMGDIGQGKTTVARHLFDMCKNSENNNIVFLTNPDFPSAMQLLKSICSEFKIEHKRSRQAQIEAFQEMLISHYAQQKNVILIVDEAQLLKGPQFELIRQLINFETNESKLIQIILFGQAELKSRLRYKKAIQSRIVASSTLDSFSLPELTDAINFRTAVAGVKNSIFSEAAFKEIYEFSKGTPRTAIQICYHALPYGFLNQQPIIGRDIINMVEQEDMYGG